ncbi:MAG: site-specific integrase [Chthoniobacterales bacterium]|nr:site-specific integrase [Chthoniobacterales bacterium]
MQRRETSLPLAPNHAAKFIPVCDSRNRRVPGLHQRNGRFYAQLWVERGDGRKTARRFALFNGDGLAVKNLAEAKEAVEIKRSERRQNALPSLGRKPTFDDYCDTYFANKIIQRKRPATLLSERMALARWREHFGQVRVDRITPALIGSHTERRLGGGIFCGNLRQPVAARTANLDLIILRNVLKLAREQGLLRELPRTKFLEEEPPPKRTLLSPGQFDGILELVTTACPKNAVQFADYLRFLAFTGAREKEALRIRWEDVDFEHAIVTIGADGLSKNGKARDVEFNPHLAALLREMDARRAPDCSWLFPSPQRGPRDVHAKRFRESLKLVRARAGLPGLGFHDFRHYFCSACVMAGIDFMTISLWLGHSDGGVLVGSVYGHLLDHHRADMAARLTIGNKQKNSG